MMCAGGTDLLQLFRFGFAGSVLWRASVSKRKFYDRANLGVQHERLIIERIFNPPYSPTCSGRGISDDVACTKAYSIRPDDLGTTNPTELILFQLRRDVACFELRSKGLFPPRLESLG
jgi:hypothetical protein